MCLVLVFICLYFLHTHLVLCFDEAFLRCLYIENYGDSGSPKWIIYNVYLLKLMKIQLLWISPFLFDTKIFFYTYLFTIFIVLNFDSMLFFKLKYLMILFENFYNEKTSTILVKITILITIKKKIISFSRKPFFRVEFFYFPNNYLKVLHWK